jgi:hypothetical protein
MSSLDALSVADIKRWFRLHRMLPPGFVFTATGTALATMALHDFSGRRVHAVVLLPSRVRMSPISKSSYFTFS